jgi:hypothetical protein
MNIANFAATLKLKMVHVLNLILGSYPNSVIVWLFIGLLGLAAVLVAARVQRFVRPDWPLLTPVVQGVSGWVLFPLAFWFFVGTWLAFLIPCFLGGATGNFGPVWDYLWPFALSCLGGSALGAMIGIFCRWYAIPTFERRAASTNSANTHFRSNDPTLVEFENLQKGCFVGCTPENQPVYVPWARMNSSHLSIIGETGSGKGIMLSNIVVQCLNSDQAVVFFDPKGDRYSPKVLAAAAHRNSKQFALLDLSSIDNAQVNPIFGCAEMQIEEMLVAGLSLQATGTDGDYHRGKDQDAAALAAAVAVKEGYNCFPSLLEKCLTIPEIAEQDNFIRKLRQLSTLRAVATENGVDLAAFVNGGHALYIIGSCDNERVKMLQKMLLIRILQIIKSRPRDGVSKPVLVVADEIQHLLSPVALGAAGVVRDFSAHICFAYQSMSDLRQCVGVDPEAAFGAIVDNTSIKIVHKISDAGYAEHLSALSGTKKVFRENVDQAFRPGEDPRKTWREDDEPVIKPETLLRLPVPTDNADGVSTGVIFGMAAPLHFRIAPIRVDGIASPAIWSAPLYRGGKLASNPEEAI